MRPFEIKKDIYWVGALDWSERDFHNFTTPRGLTYNSYLILDEMITLIDAVKHKFVEDLVEKVEKLVDLSKIKYIVINHIEPDHASGLSDILKLAKDAEIVCSQRAKDGLCKYSDCDGWKIKVVKGGDQLKIGKRTLTFVDMTMLHWPDSMAVYVEEDKILFSNDAFGQHIASEGRFDGDVDDPVYWAKMYYANILMPLSGLIKKKLEELKNLKIEMIAPSHGIVWKNPSKILEAYKKWADFESENKLVIVYDTMWNSTEMLAKAIADGAGSVGAKVYLFHVRKTSFTEIVTEILDAKAIAVGSPTLHNSVFPTIAGFLTYLKSLRPQKKKALAFGSYGWNGVGIKEVHSLLQEMKLECLEPLMVRYKPKKDEIEKAFNLGVELVK
ncbi:MAG: FprA family A-type flavoprotein [Archaeoglobaceae archaeon]|nr:FprA family A-type flavoprotein [Archaeoglobaceae archaeon]MCX8152402.1 FprA family A-type flavoprotein [Archaeoglobaceae archaeon]MDW8013742.1 FprA family A-type flavoprotein [Archaeoglobaceae archaeon]